MVKWAWFHEAAVGLRTTQYRYETTDAVIGQRSYLHQYLHMRRNRKNNKITIYIEKSNEAEVLEVSPNSDDRWYRLNPTFPRLFGKKWNILFSEISKEMLIDWCVS